MALIVTEIYVVDAEVILDDRDLASEKQHFKLSALLVTTQEWDVMWATVYDSVIYRGRRGDSFMFVCL